MDKLQKETRSDYPTRKSREIIVLGYIHDIQKILAKDIIIPDEIIQTCYAYFAVSFLLFQFKKSDKYSSIPDINMIDPYSQTVNYLSPKDKSLIPPPYKIPNHGQTSCYVHRISSILKLKHDAIDNNKSYDAIIGLHTKRNFSGRRPPMYPHIFLFESEKTNEENIKYQTFFSSQKVPSYDFSKRVQGRMISCGDKHGVIYEFDKELYQLKLQNINDLDNFNFVKIDATNQFFDKGWLSLGYIPEDVGHDKIFAINNNFVHALKSVRCGIFDLEINKWQQLENFSNSTTSRMFWFNIPCNNLDTTKVYAIMSHGEFGTMNNIMDQKGIVVASIDLNKNKWTIINNESWPNDKRRKVNDEPMVWFDDNPNILCYANLGEISCLDLRENNMKWFKMQNMKSVYKKMSNEAFFL